MLPRLPERLRQYRHTVTTFIDQLACKADQSMGASLPRDIETFRDFQLGEGKSASTANMVVKTLRFPLNLARRQGLILTIPAEGVELLEAESATRSTFSIAQLNDLLRHADWEWRVWCFRPRCGLRLADAANLTWKQVDLERKAIVYFPQKSGRGTKRKPVESIFFRRWKNGFSSRWEPMTSRIPRYFHRCLG